MKPEKYISLKLAQKLHEVAKEKGIELPESEYWWTNMRTRHLCSDLDLPVFYYEDELEINRGGKPPSRQRMIELGNGYGQFMSGVDDEGDKNDGKETIAIPAFDCQELGAILPDEIKIGKEKMALDISKEHGKWWITYEPYHTECVETCRDFCDTEPEARGKMLLYLLSNDLFRND